MTAPMGSRRQVEATCKHAGEKGLLLLPGVSTAIFAGWRLLTGNESLIDLMAGSILYFGGVPLEILPLWASAVVVWFFEFLLSSLIGCIVVLQLEKFISRARFLWALLVSLLFLLAQVFGGFIEPAYF